MNLELVFHRLVRESVAENRNVQLGGDHSEPLRVIGVLVRQKDAGQRFGGPSDAGEPIANLAPAEAGVDEQTHVIRLQIGAIAPGTTAQNCETYRHAPTLETGLTPGNGIRHSIQILLLIPILIVID